MEKREYTKCLRCNRKLRTPLAKERGYGTSCWRTYLKEQKQSSCNLFKVNFTATTNK